MRGALVTLLVGEDQEILVDYPRTPPGFEEVGRLAEVDRYWDALVRAGAKPSRCGWITDPFGLSWQIVPRRFVELVADPDPRKVKAVVDAMMTMVKLDVAALEKAYRDS